MKIAHITNLCNLAYHLCAQERKEGYESELFILTDSRGRIRQGQDPRSITKKKSLENWIHVINPLKINQAIRFISRVRKCDYAVAYTVAPVYIQFIKKQFIAYSTGSDIRELYESKSVMGNLLRRAYRKSEAIIFTNLDTHTIKNLKPFRHKAHFLDAMVQTALYTPKFIPLSKKLKIVVAASMDVKVKGTGMLLKGMSILKNLGVDFELHMVEYGPDVQAMMALADKLNLSKNIVLHSYLPEYELAKLYQNAHIIFGYFKGKNGIDHYPLSIRNSLSAGKPTITRFDRKLFQKYMKHVPPFVYANTPSQIAQKVLALRKDKQLYKKICRNSSAWVQENVSPKRIAKNLFEIYQKVFHT